MKSSDKYNVTTLNVNSAGSAERCAPTGYVSRPPRDGRQRVAGQVAGVLNDPRSWAGSGNVRFALVADPAQDSFVVSVASPATIAKYCASASGSCLVGTTLMVDALSWKYPPATYGGDAASWQSYLSIMRSAWCSARSPPVAPPPAPQHRSWPRRTATWADACPTPGLTRNGRRR